MTDDTEVFEAERPRLLGLAYRMLGTLADAEDVVQDAWLRWSGRNDAVVERPAAWLTTTTTRLALDRLRLAQRRREEYVGEWLPEPVSLGPDPAAASELADSLTLGFLVVLDRLTPLERAVFLLADVFGERFADVATIVGRREDHCRQVATRARRKVRDARPDGVVPARHETLVALLLALGTGDRDRLLTLLDADVTATSDAGGTRRAATRTIPGRDRVIAYLATLTSRHRPTVGLIEANGCPAVHVETDDGPVVLTADERDGVVVAVRMVANVDKLQRLDRSTVLS